LSSFSSASCKTRWLSGERLFIVRPFAVPWRFEMLVCLLALALEKVYEECFLHAEELNCRLDFVGTDFCDFLF
jgi:hypothetical protein